MTGRIKTAALPALLLLLSLMARTGVSGAAVIQKLSDDEARGISVDAPRYLERAKRSLKLQTEMPDDVTGQSATELPNMPDINFWRKIGEFFRRAARYVLIISIIAIAAVMAFNLRGNLWSMSRARRLNFEPETETGAAAVLRMETAQAEAGDLAEAGSFAEAMHVLLLRSVSEMRKRLDSPIAESLTSREILSVSGLSPDEKKVFETIVNCVEISYFGSHQPGEDEYAACRVSFDALTGLLRRGRSA